MTELDDLQTVLGNVGGEDFNKVIDDKIDHIKSRLGVNGLDWVLDKVETTRQPLKDLTKIDPASFTSPFGQCASMLGCEIKVPKAPDGFGDIPEHRVSTYVGNARTTVSGDNTSGGPGWDGPAATAFREDFIKYYEPDGQASLSQYWLFGALGLLVEAHQAVYARTRDDVKEMLVTAEAGAEGLVSDFGSPEGSMQFAVTTMAAVAAVSVAAIAPPAGVSAGLTLFAATSAQTASVLGAVPKEKPEPPPFDLQTGDHAALASSMIMATREIKRAQDKSRDEVRSTLDMLSNTISKSENRRLFTGPRVNGGATTIAPLPDGTTAIAPDYLDGFIPPVH